MRIVLGNSSLARYLPGGGHWCWFLQYPLALKALGHQILWLELMQSSGDPESDRRTIAGFFGQAADYGLERDSALLLFDQSLDFQPLEGAREFGISRSSLRQAIHDADLLLNFCCNVREPLLSMFRRRALLDFDPGHLQISALVWDLGIREHDVWLTIGARLGNQGCEVPTLDVEWRKFEPMVHLPMWQVTPDPGRGASFSSITQWTWEELPFGTRTVSVSKRAAYLKYLELPRRARRPIELAANIGHDDPAGDGRLLRDHGWKLVDPHEVGRTVSLYQDYIHRSRAELMCPKPVHVELRTGWFSDRSVAYLASGRPVVAEETGFSERLPTGVGLIPFRNADEAIAAIAEVDGNYAKHSRAARELAVTYFDSKRSIEAILNACA